jgi:Tol biopolymer transport system component
MTLAIGTQLGSLEITALLGKGGMGEVYRARDFKLKREVAIKILPEEFSRDNERVNRFQREAEVLASLNHPNIAAIYDLQEANGTRFLVLELVQGETLFERIARGPIPIKEALDIAHHICEALEAAHEKGVVHRDLKPANIKITTEGKVKVLDFGLAKAVETQTSPINASHSPTMMSGTLAGVILGTAAYMSPEQARGQAVNSQSDIWSFGVVLYEMLTGKPAFTGETITDVIGRIVTLDPDWSVLPETTPPAIKRLLRNCFHRNRAARLHHIGDAKIEIDGALSDPSTAAATTAAPAAPDGPVAARRRPLLWIAANAALLLIAAAIVMPFVTGYFRLASRDIGVVRFSVPQPEKGRFSEAPNAPYVSISPDGRHLAFIAESGGTSRIWVRTLDTLEARPLMTTEGVAHYPTFWSPDSRFIGFFAQGKLKKIEIAGGPAQSICDAPAMGSPAGTWNRDGIIVFSGGDSFEEAGPLKRVPAGGGTPEAVTSLDQSRQERGHEWPYFLPDGDHFFFLANSGPNSEQNGIFVGSLSSKKVQLVSHINSRMVYDPAGYLLFVRDRSLMALPFDAKKLQATGDPFPIAEQVRSRASGQASLTVSANGVLAYRTGADDVGADKLTWLDRSGKELDTAGPAGNYRNVKLSPDEKRIAVQRSDSRDEFEDIWVIDVARGVPTRLTFGQPNRFPVWSPNGDQIAFSRGSQDPAIYIKPSSGAGTEDLLLKSAGPVVAWSADGKFILYLAGRGSLTVLPLFGDRKPFEYLPRTTFQRTDAQLSADGRWVAYRSDESGKDEVYIQSFPVPSAKSRISTGGGAAPRWRRDGKEIFYLDPDQKLMSVPIRAAARTLEISTPVPLFEMRVAVDSRSPHQYDVTGDGQRFLVSSPVTQSAATPITVVVNWTAGLKK